MRFNVYFKFKGSDNQTVMMPSSLNPFNHNTLGECVAGLAPRLPDYTPVGVTPIGLVIETIGDPILGPAVAPITAATTHK